MNTNQLKFLAEWLVYCEYAQRIQVVKDGKKVDHYRLVMKEHEDFHKQVTEKFEPFSNTLIGLNQFHTIEAYLETTKNLPAHQLWLNSMHKVGGVGHVKRINRLMWVVGQYVKLL